MSEPVKATLPYPPTQLIDHVGPHGPEQGTANYDRIGALCKLLVCSVLPPDWTFKDKRVLDFGCGAGRVIRQFADVAGDAEFVGCDIDAASIDWAGEQLSPPFSFFKNRELPPLDLPDESFDLVYGMSIFTHLTDSWSAWLLELRRVLRPRALLILSFLGRDAIEAVTGEPYDDAQVGMNEVGIGNPWQVGGPVVMHSTWWLHAHFGRAFDVIQVVPASSPREGLGHGLICLRKTTQRPPTTAELERPEADEPRELSSMRHNWTRLRRELIRLYLRAIRLARGRTVRRRPQLLAEFLRILRTRSAPTSLDSLQSSLTSLKAQIKAVRDEIAASTDHGRS